MKVALSVEIRFLSSVHRVSVSSKKEREEDLLLRKKKFV